MKRSFGRIQPKYFEYYSTCNHSRAIIESHVQIRVFPHPVREGRCHELLGEDAPTDAALLSAASALHSSLWPPFLFQSADWHATLQ